MSQKDEFARLHVPGTPLVLVNVWDAGSARAVADAGAKAVASGSWGVAAAHGMADGEAVPRALAIANAAEIVAAVEVPVTIDFERGYGADAAAVAESCRLLAETGAVGTNLEDENRPVDEAAARVRAAAGSGLFVNARSDLFIKSDPASHDSAMVAAALERARAYADAGAGSFFVPFLTDEALIGDLCAASPIPVNVMRLAGTPSLSRLADLGVARVSHGPGPYRALMAKLTEDARALMAD